jgi:hypothetical protein
VTVALDTTALLALGIDGPQRTVTLAALETDDVWVASALALAEAMPAIDRLTDDPLARLDIEDAVRHVWDHLHVVPLDQRCLDDAGALARARPARMTDAIHLTAADRLTVGGSPIDTRFVTFDPVQIPLALALGFDVVST